MKKFLVIGSGAIGSFYAGKLTQGGAEVVMVSRSDCDFIKSNGINVESHLGNFHFMPKDVIKNSADYKDQADFVILSTKLLPTIDFKALLQPVLSQKTSIILLQNGIHIENSILKMFPNNHLISVIAFIGVSKMQNKTINHQDYGKLIVGDFPSGVSKKTLEFVDILCSSGIEVEANKNIQKERWKKLVWNAAFNPISVLANQSNTKQILENENLKNLVKNIMLEVCLLAKADGFELQNDIIEKHIDFTSKMKPYKTSMLLDFESGREMEIDAILGNAVKFAESKNVSIPHIKTLYSLLTSFK